MSSRTQVIPDSAVRTPWLERETTFDEPGEKIPLVKFPFTIGRQDSTDYPINSTRVSREHCRISRTSGGFKIRDLGSTNGTYVNGERIDEVPLHDGDRLSVADLEFTFFTGDAPIVDAVTQRIAPKGESAAHDDDAVGHSLVQTVRWMNETVTQGGLSTTFQRIVALEGGQTFGWDVVVFDPADAVEQAAQALLAGTDCRVTRRARHVSRLVAVERIAAARVAGRALLRVDPIELSDARLADRVGTLANLLGRGRVVVDLDENVTNDARQFRVFCEAMKEREVAVSLRGFAAGGVQMADFAECPPQFVRFAPQMTGDLADNPRRQKQVQAAIEAAVQLDAQIIVTNVTDDAQAELCRELGCHLAVGPLYGGPHAAPQVR